MSGGALITPGRCLLVGMLVFGGFAILAILEPLAVYTVTLAGFGLPHVLSELRFVDRRFGRGLSRRFLLSFSVLLPFIIAARIGAVFHLIPTDISTPAELGGVALLALSCAGGGSFPRRALALSIAAILGGATFWAPFETAVSLAILHNLTPLGFLWQMAPRPNRGWVMSAAAWVFIGLPLLVASGWPRAALTNLIGRVPNFDPLGAGPLSEHLFVYVPSQFAGTPQSIDFFTPSVVAQGAHYASVILILPLLLRRLDPGARGLVPWPSGFWFAALCFGGAAFVVGRSLDGFAEARALYSIPASLHAWIEIPILILALTETSQSDNNHSPKTHEAELATSETSMARSIRKPATHAMRAPSAKTTIASSVMIDNQ
jgi:hypothetical protein